jgi:hypothetical protein
MPEAEVFEPRRALAGHGVDWRSTPFSGEQPCNVAPGEGD